MSARAVHLVIDARPRGPHGLLAAEVVLGKSVLRHLLDLAVEHVPPGKAVVVHARGDEHDRLRELAHGSSSGGVVLVNGPPRADAAILRTDRLYDPARLQAWLAPRAIAGIGRGLAARPAGIVVDRRRRADPTPDLSAAGQVLGVSSGPPAGRAAVPDLDHGPTR